jgi:hypothetical protein
MAPGWQPSHSTVVGSPSIMQPTRLRRALVLLVACSCGGGSSSASPALGGSRSIVGRYEGASSDADLSLDVNADGSFLLWSMDKSLRAGGGGFTTPCRGRWTCHLQPDVANVLLLQPPEGEVWADDPRAKVIPMDDGSVLLADSSVLLADRHEQVRLSPKR